MNLKKKNTILCLLNPNTHCFEMKCFDKSLGKTSQTDVWVYLVQSVSFWFIDTNVPHSLAILSNMSTTNELVLKL
jgi:hypothetical protein